MSTHDADKSQSSRNSWLPDGLLAAILISVLICFVAWYTFRRPSCSATALFRVNSQPMTLWGGEAESFNPREFERLKSTQVQVIKSYIVLQSAIHNPGIASLSIFAGKADPIEWLQENIEVDYPGDAEVLEIRLRGNHVFENDIRQVVDAVATAYEQEVASAAEGRQQRLRDSLSKALSKLDNELKQKMDTLFEIKKAVGPEESVDVSLRQQEVDTLAEIGREMRRRLEIININANLPKEMHRIIKIQPAVISKE